MANPIVIQGGMGAAVSNWRLARAVSQMGQLGVVSGTALDNVFARRLQEGDKDGEMRRAMGHFPEPSVAKRVLDKYFIEGGKKSDKPYKPVPLFSFDPPQELLELTVLANFVEVFLAKEGHDGLVGINFLEKVQLPTLPSLYGALLAGVDYVIVGAGIPRAIPALLTTLVAHEKTALKVYVQGASAEDQFETRFDPKRVIATTLPTLKRPKFLAVVASDVLATTLAKKSSGVVDGFVVEGPTAGGHNAPPRGSAPLDEKGEPVYGPKDQVDLGVLRKLGLPFWLAGSYGNPEKVKEAIELGAQGIQAGTLFAFCQESGLMESLKQDVYQLVLGKGAEVFTDPVASPTGFPFKILQLEGTMSDPAVYEARERICDLGYLRSAYKRPDGTVGFRCPGEPEKVYLQKGGALEDTPCRKCLCNGLLADIGLPQVRTDGRAERPLVTCGNDVNSISIFQKNGKIAYGAKDVILYLMGGLSGAGPVMA